MLMLNGKEMAKHMHSAVLPTQYLTSLQSINTALYRFIDYCVFTDLNNASSISDFPLKSKS
jgi:hypothetical protein